MIPGSPGLASLLQPLLANIPASSLLPPPAFATDGFACTVRSQAPKKALATSPWDCPRHGGFFQSEKVTAELTSAVPEGFVIVAPHLGCEQGFFLAPSKHVSAAVRTQGPHVP